MLESKAAAALLIKRRKRFAIDTYCFAQQKAFLQDEAKFKTAVCSRRSGKTVGCAVDLIDTALKFKDTVSLYLTLSRKNAKRIVWPELLRVNRDFGLNGKINETDLSIKYGNGAMIYVSGAKDKTEIENYRGMALKKAYIDEAQAFGSYIEGLIDDVISKALFDHDGTLCLIGTPGMVPAGYFHDCSHSSKWSHHSWTMFDNPHLELKSGKTAMQLVKEDCERMGVGLDHPKIQRECYGKWVIDTESLVFKYNSEKNHYASLPDFQAWETVIGVDLGFDDSDAIAVLGWNPNDKRCYLIEEHVRAKQSVTDLAGKIAEIIERHNPLRVVMDTGGLGKKIAEELRKRFSLPIVAAEKSRKFEYIELLNDGMRTGRFFANKDSRFAQDSMLVEWDRDASTPDRLKVSDTYHSDITDAVLYAYREAMHWLSEEKAPAPKPNTKEWFDAEAKRMEQQVIDKLEREKSEDNWGDLEW